MARFAAVSYPAGCGLTANSRVTFSGARIRNSSSPASRNILLPQLDRFAQQRFGKRVIHLAVRWVLDQGITAGLWGARHPSQLQPVDEVSGWSLDASAKAEIDRILSTTISEPIGPEFMAPPRAASRPLNRRNHCCKPSQGEVVRDQNVRGFGCVVDVDRHWTSPRPSGCRCWPDGETSSPEMTPQAVPEMPRTARKPVPLSHWRRSPGHPFVGVRRLSG